MAALGPRSACAARKRSIASSKRRFSRFEYPVKGIGAGVAGGGAQRNVEAVDGVEKEERAHAFVEVVAGAAEAIERLALGEQIFER